MISEAIETGRIVDLILALVLLEGLLLIAFHKFSGRGLQPSRLIANLAAGASLLLALRAALTDAGPTVIAAMLLVSLLAHLWDLAMRWT